MLAMIRNASRRTAFADADANASERWQKPTDVTFGMFLIFDLNSYRMSPKGPECAQSRGQP